MYSRIPVSIPFGIWMTIRIQVERIKQKPNKAINESAETAPKSEIHCIFHCFHWKKLWCVPQKPLGRLRVTKTEALELWNYQTLPWDKICDVLHLISKVTTTSRSIAYIPPGSLDNLKCQRPVIKPVKIQVSMGCLKYKTVCFNRIP